MKRFSIALLSTAHIQTKSFLQHLNDGTDRTAYAIWDDDIKRGQKYAGEFRAKFFSDLDELLQQSSVTGFVIGAENSRHFSLLERTIPLGKPVLCQKPLVTSNQDLEKIKLLLEKYPTPLCSAYHLPFTGAMQAVQKLLKEEAFGKVTRIRYRYAHQAAYGLWFDNPELAWFHDPNLSGGGAFMDLGTNAIHLLRTLFGSAQRIWACIRNESKVYPQVDDFGMAVIEFKGNILATVEAAWTQTGGIGGLEIIGSKKSLWHDGTRYVVGKPGAEAVALIEAPPKPSQVERLVAILNKEIPDDELAADRDAIFDSVRIVEAAYESSRLEKWIELK